MNVNIAAQLERDFGDLIWALDHGIATDAQLAYAKWLGLDTAAARADFPHYSS